MADSVIGQLFGGRTIDKLSEREKKVLKMMSRNAPANSPIHSQRLPALKETVKKKMRGKAYFKWAVTRVIDQNRKAITSTTELTPDLVIKKLKTSPDVRLTISLRKMLSKNTEWRIKFFDEGGLIALLDILNFYADRRLSISEVLLLEETAFAIRELANSEEIYQRISRDKGHVDSLISALCFENSRFRSEIFKVLLAICELSFEGFNNVHDSLRNFQEKYDKKTILEPMQQEIRTQRSDVAKWISLALINSFLFRCEPDQRIFYRDELTRPLSPVQSPKDRTENFENVLFDLKQYDENLYGAVVDEYFNSKQKDDDLYINKEALRIRKRPEKVFNSLINQIYNDDEKIEILVGVLECLRDSTSGNLKNKWKHIKDAVLNSMRAGPQIKSQPGDENNQEATKHSANNTHDNPQSGLTLASIPAAPPLFPSTAVSTNPASPSVPSALHTIPVAPPLTTSAPSSFPVAPPMMPSTTASIPAAPPLIPSAPPLAPHAPPLIPSAPPLAPPAPPVIPKAPALNSTATATQKAPLLPHPSAPAGASGDAPPLPPMIRKTAMFTKSHTYPFESNLRKTLPKTSKTLRKIKWKPVDGNCIGNEKCLWSQINKTAAEIDIDKVEKNFECEAAEKYVLPSNKPATKSQESVFDHKRLLGVNIVMKQIKNIDRFLSAVKKLDEGRVKVDTLKSLIKTLPSDKELSAVRTLNENEQCDPALSFLLQLSGIDEYRLRLELMQFKIEAPDSLSLIESHLNQIHKMSSAMLHSAALKDILAHILAVGNFLESDHENKFVYGFQLALLPELKAIRCNEPGVSMLHLVISSFPSRIIENLIRDFKGVENTASFNDAKADFNAFKKMKTQLIAKLSHSRIPAVQYDFMEQLESRTTILDNLTSEIDGDQAAIVAYFGGTKQSTLDSYLAIFKHFIPQVQALYQEMAEAALAETRKRSVTINATSRYKPSYVVDPNNLVDSLLSEMKSKHQKLKDQRYKKFVGALN